MGITLQRLGKILASIFFLGICLWGCVPTANTSAIDTSAVPPISQPVTQAAAPKNMTAFPNLPRLSGKATVEMTLTSGVVTMEIDGDNAPITAGNFIDLVQRGFYNNLTFHRVVREPNPFVVQGGDPLGNGTGGFADPQTGVKRTIPLEIVPANQTTPVYGHTLPPTTPPRLRHDRGAVAMARSQQPDSASSQFYIALDNIYFLDGSYAVFGYVRQGMELVDRISVGDRILSMRVVRGGT